MWGEVLSSTFPSWHSLNWGFHFYLLLQHHARWLYLSVHTHAPHLEAQQSSLLRSSLLQACLELTWTSNAPREAEKWALLPPGSQSRRWQGEECRNGRKRANSSFYIVFLCRKLKAYFVECMDWLLWQPKYARTVLCRPCKKHLWRVTIKRS